MVEHTYTCDNCGSTFIKNYIMSKGNWVNGKFNPTKKYCSKECRQESRAKERSYKPCKVCNKDVRQGGNNKGIFCSKKCYGSRMNTHPKEFGLLKRAEKMRESWDENAWKKSIQTRKDNGNIIDWNIAEWKQYWRRCNDLTRKMRVKLLDEWDGIDYIDGKNILHNLMLPASHAEYPTLDHVKPRSQGFREVLTPYEISNPANLKWTTRRNNSSKYNKKSG